MKQRGRAAYPDLTSVESQILPPIMIGQIEISPGSDWLTKPPVPWRTTPCPSLSLSILLYGVPISFSSALLIAKWVRTLRMS